MYHSTTTNSNNNNNNNNTNSINIDSESSYDQLNNNNNNHDYIINSNYDNKRKENQISSNSLTDIKESDLVIESKLKRIKSIFASNDHDHDNMVQNNNNNNTCNIFQHINSSIISIIESSIQEIVSESDSTNNNNNNNNNNSNNISNSELISIQLIKQLLPNKIINKLYTSTLTSLSNIIPQLSQLNYNNSNNNNNNSNDLNNSINYNNSFQLLNNHMGLSPVLTSELELRIINILLSSLLVNDYDINNNNTNINNNNNYNLDNILLFKQYEEDKWSISINNPELYKQYKIPFFNRYNEYGDNHIYYEALLHGESDSNNIFNIITTSTPRFNDRGEIAINQDLLPANIYIISFIDSFREINSKLLNELEIELKLISFPYIKEFILGLFKNIAIQIHYGEPTKNINTLMHKDLINSAIHLSLTLSGNRDVIFQPNIRKKNNIFTLHCKQQTVYLTSPTKISHGIKVSKINNNNNPSIAIQFRTLLSSKIATKLGQPELRNKLCSVVLKVLKRLNQNIVLPTYQQFYNKYIELIDRANLKLKSKRKINPNIIYHNTAFTGTD